MFVNPSLQGLIDLALQEDLGSGDLTTDALFDESHTTRAHFVTKEALVVSGLHVAKAVFSRFDPACQYENEVAEGTSVKTNQAIMTVLGPTRAILSSERTALNFVRRLCGIASLTKKYVSALAGTGCRLLDTRKTTPGWRILEKAAVRAGSGCNHRMGLFDGVMIKDNHVDVAGSIARAIAKVRKSIPPTIKIEVECDNLRQVRSAVSAGADMIMLDNMSPAQMEKALEIIDGQALTEASGRLDLSTIRAAALTGVDFVSVGALTHSAPAADISLDVEV